MLALPLIVILNASRVSDTTVERWVAAIQRQVHEDFAPQWNIDATIQFAHVAPSGAWQITVVDHLSKNHKGEMAYHRSVQNALPVGEVAVSGDTSVSLSHETLEMAIDPNINRYIEFGMRMYWAEPVDPVENDSYRKDGVDVSDFVLPRWFDAPEAQPGVVYDFMGLVKMPRLVRPGAYIDYVDTFPSYWLKQIGR